MLTSVQFVGVAVKPLNVMTPGVVPKSDPAMVTASPRWAIAGVADVTVGGGMTVNVQLLPGHVLNTPPTVTTTGPAPTVDPTGTGTVIELLFQVAGVAALPLNVTVLVPRVAPKSVPVIVTDVLAGPLVGARLEIDGGGGGMGVSTRESYCPRVTPSTANSTCTAFVTF